MSEITITKKDATFIQHICLELQGLYYDIQQKQVLPSDISIEMQKRKDKLREFYQKIEAKLYKLQNSCNKTEMKNNE